MSTKVIRDVLEIFQKGWNQQVILYGPPGTSKTYSSTIIAAAMISKFKFEKKNYPDDEKGKVNNLEIDLKSHLKTVLGKKEDDSKNLFELASDFLKNNQQRYKLVQFHPSYSYEDFVRGITVKPEENEKGEKTGNILYKVEAKIIEKFCDDYKKSGGSDDSSLVLIIDEINRAPLASVLGELIYGLEYRGENISTPYVIEGQDLTIPKNLYIIGTMNTADRSIGSMDYAVRRRFAFIPVLSDDSSIEGSWPSEEKINNDTVGKIASNLYHGLMGDNGIFGKDCIADNEMDVDDIKIGHTYFLGKSEAGLDYLKYRVQYQILPIYQEYIKDGLINKEPGLKKFKEAVKGAMGEDFANNLLPGIAVKNENDRKSERQ